MAVPPDVAKLELVETQDRSVWGAFAHKDFGFGPYRVTDVDRNATTTEAEKSGLFSNQETTGGYAYRFRAGEQTLAGKCALSAAKSQTELGRGFRLGSESSQLGCTCDAGGISSSVLIARRSHDAYEGQLRLGDETFAVTSLHELAHSSATLSDPAGYRVDRNGAVAGVEVLFPGRVWFAAELREPQRLWVGCLFAGLMLYQPPSDT